MPIGWLHGIAQKRGWNFGAAGGVFMKRRYQLSKSASPLILVFLMACTVIAHQKVEGWPELKVTVHEVSYSQVVKKCYATLSPFMKAIGSLPMACAWFDLDRRTCDIYISRDSDPSILEHELEHCSGSDHVGSTHMKDFLNAYRGNK